jgi:hypothetical protein
MLDLLWKTYDNKRFQVNQTHLLQCFICSTSTIFKDKERKNEPARRLSTITIYLRKMLTGAPETLVKKIKYGKVILEIVWSMFLKYKN